MVFNAIRNDRYGLAIALMWLFFPLTITYLVSLPALVLIGMSVYGIFCVFKSSYDLVNGTFILNYSVYDQYSAIFVTAQRLTHILEEFCKTETDILMNVKFINRMVTNERGNILNQTSHIVDNVQSANRFANTQNYSSAIGGTTITTSVPSTTGVSARPIRPTRPTSPINTITVQTMVSGTSAPVQYMYSAHQIRKMMIDVWKMFLSQIHVEAFEAVDRQFITIDEIETFSEWIFVGFPSTVVLSLAKRSSDTDDGLLCADGNVLTRNNIPHDGFATEIYNKLILIKNTYKNLNITDDEFILIKKKLLRSHSNDESDDSAYSSEERRVELFRMCAEIENVSIIVSQNMFFKANCAYAINTFLSKYENRQNTPNNVV